MRGIILHHKMRSSEGWGRKIELRMKVEVLPMTSFNPNWISVCVGVGLCLRECVRVWGEEEGARA